MSLAYQPPWRVRNILVFSILMPLSRRYVAQKNGIKVMAND